MGAVPRSARTDTATPTAIRKTPSRKTRKRLSCRIIYRHDQPRRTPSAIVSGTRILPLFIIFSFEAVLHPAVTLLILRKAAMQWIQRLIIGNWHNRHADATRCEVQRSCFNSRPSSSRDRGCSLEVVFWRGLRWTRTIPQNPLSPNERRRANFDGKSISTTKDKSRPGPARFYPTQWRTDWHHVFARRI